MYQSVYYDYRSKTYTIRDDEQGWQSFKYTPTYYKRIRSFQEGAFPVLTGGWAFPVKSFDKEDNNVLEKDINKELMILRDIYYEQDDVIPKFHNILFLDIETEMGGALTPEYVKSAPKPVTSIALLDRTTKQKICFISDKSGQLKNIEKDNKLIIPCMDEEEMFLKFLNKWEELDPTIVCGYHSSYFDIPYLYYRLLQVVGNKETLRLSPIKQINVQDWDEINQIRIGGINHLDFLLLIKKYEQRQEPSYKLADVAIRYTDLEKIEYEGNLNNLYKEDINKFIDYNIRDVEIIDQLEDNFKFIELTILISHICSIPYEQIHYNTAMNEGAILKYLKREKIVSPNKPTTHNPHLKTVVDTYAGGYVKEANPGLYFDVIDLDFTSLYPSIIKSLNLGIETLVGRIKSSNRNFEQEMSMEKLLERDPTEEITIERLDKISYTLDSTKTTIGDIINIINENHYTIAASGGIFDTNVKSSSTIILEGWFKKREHYRSLKKEAGKNKDWVKYKSYDLFQYAFKILQNALYGTYAKNGWRYTDGHKICSAAITNSGQRLTQESVSFVNEKINKQLKTKKDYIIISDTDSLYISLQDILENKHGKNIKDKNQKILEISKEIQDEANFYLNTLSKKLFNIDPKLHYFQLKQEVIAQSVLTTGKRRYGMFITNKEGVDIPPDNKEAFDAKGLELFKSNMNKIFRVFGEKLIRAILFGEPKEEIDQSIIDIYRSLRNIDFRLLGKPTGVSYIKKYTKRNPLVGEIFSKLEKGAPMNTKSAIYYNDLLKFKNLDKKYEPIIEGDKIFIINLKENPYRIDTIAIPNSKIPKDVDKFINDYIDIDGIFESILLSKLKELYKDIGWSFPLLNPHIAKFFAFD